jgi:chromosome segregation ATPase
MESGSVSEDENLLTTGRRPPENKYGARTNEVPSGQSRSRAPMSPRGMRATSGQIPEIPSSSSSSSSTQRHSSTSSEPPPQQRGSLTGEYSEEGSADTDSISSLDRTGHTLAIGEETGQKERVIVHAPEPLMPTFSTHSQSDDSEREDHTMAAQISALSEQNQQLESQLREMEEERERLREMLSGEKGAGATAGDVAYTPPGLPSKVLDGRKVMEKGGKRTDKHLSSEEDLLSKIDSLHKSCCDLEERLHELSEEKRRVETESVTQREALHKMQDREQDLSKDIETLRDENSHHSGTLSKLQEEHSQLHTENASLLSELSTFSEKLSTVQKCYRQAEQENMHLADELREMQRERDKLYERVMRLQVKHVTQRGI